MNTSNAASGDLPDCFKSRYTNIHSLGQDKKQPKGKSILPELRAGVSADAPLHFRTSFIKSVDPGLRNKYISGRDGTPDRFLSSLKQNKLAENPKFIYQDFEFGATKKLHDFDTIKLSEILDLNAGTRQDVKIQSSYYKNYYERLKTSSGFGLNRGEFTFRSMQPSVERYRVGKLSALQNNKQTLNYTSKKSSSEKPKDELESTSSYLNAASVSIEPAKSTRTKRLKKMHHSMDMSPSQVSASKLSEDIKAFEGRIQNDGWAQGKSPHKLYTTSYKVITN